jgi:hypothetical protein
MAPPPLGAGPPPMGAQPMGAQPMGAQPMGAQPMGAPPMGAPPMGAPSCEAPLQAPPAMAPQMMITEGESASATTLPLTSMEASVAPMEIIHGMGGGDGQQMAGNGNGKRRKRMEGRPYGVEDGKGPMDPEPQRWFRKNTLEMLRDPTGNKSLAPGLPRRLAEAGDWETAEKIVYKWAFSKGCVPGPSRLMLPVEKTCSRG